MQIHPQNPAAITYSQIQLQQRPRADSALSFLSKGRSILEMQAEPPKLLSQIIYCAKVPVNNFVFVFFYVLF